MHVLKKQAESVANLRANKTSLLSKSTKKTAAGNIEE